ncbi:MAG: hypothetical protein AAF961_07345, partial [Planctomycetota bacterium]
FGDNQNAGGEEETIDDGPLSDEEVRQMWLRQVQTTPGEFLKAKFAYQNVARRKGDVANE